MNDGLSAMVRSRSDAGAAIFEYSSFPNHNVLLGRGSLLARFQALRTWLHFIQSLWDKTSASPMLTRMRDCGARSRSFAFLREGLNFVAKA